MYLLYLSLHYLRYSPPLTNGFHRSVLHPPGEPNLGHRQGEERYQRDGHRDSEIGAQDQEPAAAALLGRHGRLDRKSKLALD